MFFIYFEFLLYFSKIITFLPVSLPKFYSVVPPNKNPLAVKSILMKWFQLALVVGPWEYFSLKCWILNSLFLFEQNQQSWICLWSLTLTEFLCNWYVNSFWNILLLIKQFLLLIVFTFFYNLKMIYSFLSIYHIIIIFYVSLTKLNQDQIFILLPYSLFSTFFFTFVKIISNIRNFIFNFRNSKLTP